MKYPTVLVLGRTNVGKSTLFNRLVGGQFAITHSTEHTTRDIKVQPIKWNGKNFNLVDSGGFDLEQKTDLAQAVIRQIEKAMASAEAIILVIDGVTGWHQQENQIFRKILKQNKKLVVAANKLDSPDLRKSQKIQNNFKRGGCLPILISAKNGGGTGDLLDAVVSLLMNAQDGALPTRSLKVAIIGKTNVGKSALTNALLGEEIRVVSDIPHTTRDAAEYAVNFQGHSLTLIDTAGVRTRGRTADQIEALSLKATLEALEQADIAMLVWRVDEKIGLVEKTLASKAADSGKGLLLVANQSDLLKSREYKSLNIAEQNFRRSLEFVNWAPMIFASALKKINLNKILTAVIEIESEILRRISQDDLQKVARQIIQSLNLNFILRKKLRAKLLQMDSHVPSFEMHINLRTALPNAVARIAEKKLRAAFGFRGAPIICKLIQPFAKKI